MGSVNTLESSAGENSNNFWWSIELEAEGGGAEEALFTLADLSGSVGSELLEENKENEKNGVKVLRAAYLTSRDVSHWLAAIDSLMENFPNVRVRSHAKIENKPWHTEHLEAFPPLPVGDGLVVAAPWHKGSVAEAFSSRLPVYIHPSSAFGTGYHESTQIALSLVEKFLKAGDVILDMGTGSGILFIAGLKLGAAHAVARDIDPVAVAESKRNMEVNGIPESACDLCAEDIFDAQIAVQADVLTSNILLSPNIKLLGRLKNILKPSGVAIFSGMTAAERTEFLPALSEAELSIMEELTINDWWGCAAVWKSPERGGQ